jgi:hypothetical protein
MLGRRTVGATMHPCINAAAERSLNSASARYCLLTRITFRPTRLVMDPPRSGGARLSSASGSASLGSAGAELPANLAVRVLRGVDVHVQEMLAQVGLER